MPTDHVHPGTFANGYGASVIRDPRDPSLAEVAVTNAAGEFVYDTPITQDVRSGVRPIDIDQVLDQIAALPVRSVNAPSGSATRPPFEGPTQ